ncbi:MAG: [protein-PII] uridylyltransferase, partial [Pseudorhodobacter sp.]|nr:[protein-PII] uridylyltransferase [Pseudorhodobacter sp.]
MPRTKAEKALPAAAVAGIPFPSLPQLSFDDLLLPPEAILDEAALLAQIKQEIATNAPLDGRSGRAIVVKHLAEARVHANDRLSQAFTRNPAEARGLIRALAWLTDRIVCIALDVATTTLHPLANPTEAERIAVVAVGGYGRAEMAPHSDVDLLFLTPWKVTPWAESAIESVLYMLWDLKLKVGHATRTVKDCLRLAREDITIRTALLERRFLAGDESLARELREKLWSDLFLKTGPEFIEAKLAERTARHKRQGGQRYVLEPNIKEGKGGLRDLQTLYWIGKYLHRVQTASGLVQAGLLDQEEYNVFATAENFLWDVRCHLHYITGRAMDTLTFDMQVEVAARLGYADAGGRRAVEHFMQDYFRHATRVGELTRVFLTQLEARHAKSEPALIGFFRRRKKLKYGFALEQGRIVFGAGNNFSAEPLNLLRIFEEGLRTGYLIHPSAMRVISANLHLIDDTLRADRETQRIFLDLLLKHGNPERALRRMNELDVLSAIIPEFEPIVAMMQFNVYHHYTV